MTSAVVVLVVPFPLALPALLALPLLETRVFVDTSTVAGSEVSEAEARRLDGALRVRLLEEGYVLAPRPGASTLRLEVRPFEGGWMVLARGQGTSSYALPAGPLALRSLELLQRAGMALDAARASPTTGSDAETIAVSVAVSAAADEPLGSRAQQEMVQALIAAGMAVAPVARSQGAVVCLGVTAESFSLGAGSDAASCQASAAAQPRAGRSEQEIRKIVGRRSASLALDALALRNAARDLSTPSASDAARDSSAKPLPAAPSKAKPPPKPASTPAHDPELTRGDDERREAAASQLTVALSGGVLARSGGTDPLLRAQVDVGLRSGWGVRFEPRFSWSGLPSLGIFETSLLAGPTWTRPLGEASSFTLGLLGGAVLHTFEYSQSDRGTRVNWGVSLPAELSRRVSALTFTLGLAPGLSGPARNHEVFGRRVWHRGALALAASAGVGMRL